MSTLNYSWVNLVDNPSYNCYANCLGSVLSFTFTWVGRSKKRFVTIYDDTGDVILQNTALNIDEVLEFDMNIDGDMTRVYLILSFIPNTDKNIDYLNWKRNMMLTVFNLTEE